MDNITIKNGMTVIIDTTDNGVQRHAVLGASDWDAAAFRLNGDWCGTLRGFAANVVVTGRKVLYNGKFGRKGAIRVAIVLPGDGEGDTRLSGWICAEEERGEVVLNP